MAIFETQFFIGNIKAQFSLAISKAQFPLAISKAQSSLAISKAQVPADDIQSPFFHWHYFIKKPEIIKHLAKRKVSWHNYCLSITMAKNHDNHFIKAHMELS